MSGDNSFSRPERSSARTSEGNGGDFGMTQSLSNSANRLYQNAPDLGVGATISSYLGSGRTKQADTFDKQEDDRVLRNDNVKSTDSDLKQGSSSSNNNNNEGETPRQLSERIGPSSKERVGKSQFQLGTETGIPTTAGVGSTASPDKTNQKAIEKANSQGKINKAHIPDDFEPLSSTLINDRRRSSLSSKKRTSVTNGGGSGKNSPHTDNRKSSGNYVPPLTSDGSPIEMEKRRSISEKLMDQVKGEIKILAGTVTGSDDKILQGLAIKHADNH